MNLQTMVHQIWVPARLSLRSASLALGVPVTLLRKVSWALSLFRVHDALLVSHSNPPPPPPPSVSRYFIRVLFLSATAHIRFMKNLTDRDHMQLATANDSVHASTEKVSEVLTFPGLVDFVTIWVKIGENW